MKHILHKNSVEFVCDGDDFTGKVLELIEGARFYLMLQYYIFDLDAFGEQVYQGLLRAKKRSVDVYLLIDDVGSHDFPKSKEEELLAAGVHFQRFNKFFNWKFFQWGRRLHHKVIVADHLRGIVGGINIYLAINSHEHYLPRLDFAVSLEGAIVQDISRYCEHIYYRRKRWHLDLHPKMMKPNRAHAEKVQLSVNDWVYHRLQIGRNYRDLIETATESIFIVSSYFFPRKVFLNKLIAARKREVVIRLILPKRSDWLSWVYASEFFFPLLLQNDIEIYQWNQSILHGKMACIDGWWTTIGSFNLNYTSYQGNLEMNIDIHSPDFAREVKTRFNSFILSGCEKITAQNFTKNSGVWVSFKRRFYYLALVIIANFSLAFIFQAKKLKKGRFS
jgi:cardiolipin synthase